MVRQIEMHYPKRNEAQKAMKVMKRCPQCGWRIFDKITPTSGIIQMKCPNCRKIVEIDLSFRRVV